MKDIHQVVKRDLEILELMVAEMEGYLMSEATHWIMARGDMPKLTIGGCLMRLSRLPVVKKTLLPEEKTRLADAEQLFGRLLANHTVRFEQRVHQETRARLAQWSGYLGHMSSRTLADVEYFSSVVDTRVVITAMVNKLKDPPLRLAPEILEELNALDQNLHGRWQVGPFVWPEVWQIAYSPDPYWYLYGRPKKSNI